MGVNDVSKSREYSLKQRYGITPAQYQELLDRQGGCCALCKKTEAEEGKSLAVDHNHKTGEIRGILCAYCNHRVIGRHVDPDLLRRMADYLDKGTGWFVPEKKRKKRKKSGSTTRSKSPRTRHRVEAD
jgi:DNA-directed RNA polymerase subunit RPC12/RpoP